MALGIASRGIAVACKDSKDVSFAVRKYWEGLKSRNMAHMKDSKTDYHSSSPAHIVEASLAACVELDRKEGHGLNMRNRFESLCIPQKQQSVLESTLVPYWKLESMM